ncbi:MAG: VanW family protein [Polyangiales bacterium]
MVFPSKKTLEKLRLGAGAACVVGSTMLAIPWATLAPSAHAASSARATFLGAPLSASTDSRAEAQRLARAFLDTPIELAIGSDVRRTTRRALGVTVDEDTLAAWLEGSRDPGSDFAKRREAMGLTGPIDLTVPYTLDEAPLRALLLATKTTFDRAAVNAKVDLETGAIVPEREGLALDVFGTLEAFREALVAGRGRLEARIAHTPATRTRAQLDGVSIAAVLGEFETRYNTAADAAERTHNLKVAASRIDGLVLLPGETFEYNRVVGERNQANGFRPAPEIAGGELSEGIGGGACQISGTLHAAAFFAGLPIVSRQPHSRPSSYIKLGLDAMVSWPKLDFAFRNDLPHPVVLRMTVTGGTVTARILGPERKAMVSFVRRIDQITPFDERVDEDPSLPAGVRVLVQRGMPGFRITRFRIVRDTRTNQAVRERYRDTYPPTLQIWRVGTGGPVPRDFVPPEGDRHPEYRADAYVILTQGPGVEGTQEWGVAGASGVTGWTARAGMPAAP